MKTSTAALAVLFVAAICYQVSASPVSLSFSSPCCYQYSTKTLPSRLAVQYEYTGSHCSQPAVIFTTAQGRLVCGNPNDIWVQNLVNRLKDKQAVTEQPSPL